jgi:hypothetical protein
MEKPTITPHVLCDVCKKSCQKSRLLPLLLRHRIPPGHKVEDPMEDIACHSTLKKLYKSALRGCHLCNLILCYVYPSRGSQIRLQLEVSCSGQVPLGYLSLYFHDETGSPSGPISVLSVLPLAPQPKWFTCMYQDAARCLIKTKF